MDKVDVDQNTPLCYNAVSCVVKVVPLQIYELKEEEESWCFVLTRATQQHDLLDFEFSRLDLRGRREFDLSH